LIDKMLDMKYLPVCAFTPGEPQYRINGFGSGGRASSNATYSLQPGVVTSASA
jgi:hypothetical protein